jgi:hypothetical protein
VTCLLLAPFALVGLGVLLFAAYVWVVVNVIWVAR